MTKIPIDSMIAWTLRLGVIASATLLATGLALGYSPQLAGTGNYLLVLGIAVLFATPVVRVFLSIFSFAMERNWLYAAITLIVFIDILVALFVVPALLHL